MLRWQLCHSCQQAGLFVGFVHAQLPLRGNTRTYGDTALLVLSIVKPNKAHMMLRIQKEELQICGGKHPLAPFLRVSGRSNSAFHEAQRDCRCWAEKAQLNTWRGGYFPSCPVSSPASPTTIALVTRVLSPSESPPDASSKTGCSARWV